MYLFSSSIASLKKRTHIVADNRILKRESTFKIFRKSNFFIAVLLILTFVFFMLIPDLVYLFYGIVGNNKSDTLLAICEVLYAVSALANGWIYIFMQKSVRAIVWTKMRSLKSSISRRTLSSQNRPQDTISTIDSISMCRIPGGTIANINQVDKASKVDLSVENLKEDVTEING